MFRYKLKVERKPKAQVLCPVPGDGKEKGGAPANPRDQSGGPTHQQERGQQEKEKPAAKQLAVPWNHSTPVRVLTSKPQIRK